jgi:hypothetical protein
MRFITASILLVLAASANAQDKWEPNWSKFVDSQPGSLNLHPEIHNNEEKRSGRIVGGQIVAPNSFPFQAAVQIFISGLGSSHCSGSIITSRAVLTAAHWYVSKQIILKTVFTSIS